MTRKAGILIASATALVMLTCAQSQVAPQPAQLQSSVRTGTRIAFAYDNDLYTMNPDGSDIENLTEHVDQFLDDPDWSPDGKRLLLYCGDYDICMINSDGSGFRQITDTPRWHAYTGPKWSPSGQRLAFVDANGCLKGSERCAREGYGPRAGIYVMRLDGSHKSSVYQHRVLAIDWSSTGWIAFSNGFGIYKIRPDGSQLTRLSRGVDTAPPWSADGKWIVFERTTDPDFYGDIYKMRADGSDVQKLTSGAYSPSWSPTSRWILFESTGGPVNIWKMRSDGTHQQGLTDGGDPTWQPKATGPGRSEEGLGALEIPYTPSADPRLRTSSRP